ncbi:MAG: hypothetical protein GAK28_01747 [Luteibacter sp.]|uniref:DUF4232 domain-containing protein n=1 Tax=Luteibacter sp. TaxID=1886636 RepID=UPI001384F1A1|nr:DUF4232 domain-containing protein [Luteibacter sp.]KAF1007405.1 MAG: hypothetical protein GAK28_01747 [Luteibacter sp.]
MITALLIALALTPSSPSETPTACRAQDLSITFDSKDGEFNGMSHSGTLMSIRQHGSSTCLLPGIPQLSFTDADGKPLPVARVVPRGMHPGPVIVPVKLAPGATATSALRWVSGEVYDPSRCVDAARVSVAIGKETVKVPFTGHFCGVANQTIRFEQPVLQPAGHS